MEIRQQAIQEYLTKGTTFRDLAAKYGVSRTTIPHSSKPWTLEVTLNTLS